MCLYRNYATFIQEQFSLLCEIHNEISIIIRLTKNLQLSRCKIQLKIPIFSSKYSPRKKKQVFKYQNISLSKLFKEREKFQSRSREFKFESSDKQKKKKKNK